MKADDSIPRRTVQAEEMINSGKQKYKYKNPAAVPQKLGRFDGR